MMAPWGYRSCSIGCWLEIVLGTLGIAAVLAATTAEGGEPLPGTEPLTWEGDVAERLVAQADRFLDRQIALVAAQRQRLWRESVASPAAFEGWAEACRQALTAALGLVDPRQAFEAPQLLATTQHSARVGHGTSYDIYAVRWPAVRGVHGEGLLLVPRGTRRADIVALPDADQTPEQLCGLAPGLPPPSQFARVLAENGCRVLVPTLISRTLTRRGPPGQPGRVNLTNREFVYRPGFELGRHLLGYELQKVLAGVDWMAREGASSPARLGIIGYGEGALLALYAKTIDPRIQAACISGYLTEARRYWEEPIDRNLFGLWGQASDVELADLASAGRLVVEAASGPTVRLPSEGGAPAQMTWPTPDDTRRAVQSCHFFAPQRLPEPARELASGRQILLASAPPRAETDAPTFAGPEALTLFLQALVTQINLTLSENPPEADAPGPDPATRQERLVQEILADTQSLLAESPYVRQTLLRRLTSAASAEDYQRIAAEYRELFATRVLGRFDEPLVPPRPRTRQAYETPAWTGYEVVLDVFPDLFAYGILCVPKDIPPGQRRPVVVCQHGLEGRPQDVIGPQRKEVYEAFAGQLAARGLVTFAPQNLYIGKDRFRSLQRKANPLGKTLFSIMVPQHQQICRWLRSLPMVDGERIAFYGLSYGGKSAMRIPPLVQDYCLSICSADFNDWVDKCASTRAPYSYVWTGEYEIFEWNLGSTFNYAEMAALIAPRPFMVERGYFDAVGVVVRVAAEYAKVQRLYEVQLRLPERCRIEWFVGPHKIHGKGTFAFLEQWLDWPIKPIP
jgi:dienelactone hydrolase